MSKKFLQETNFQNDEVLDAKSDEEVTKENRIRQKYKQWQEIPNPDNQ